MSHAVFISYADNEKDRKIALAVCSTLESRGLQCWMAPRDILPGKHYAEAIVEAISKAQVMVVVLSSSANSSPQVLREVERASSRDIPIVTFRVEDVPLKKALEYFLSSYHWLEATNLPLEASSKQLADTIERLLLPPEEQSSAEKKREASKPVAAEKKAHPIWFWLGLLLFVSGLEAMIALFMVQVGSSGKANISLGVVLACDLPFVFTGVILVWLSRRDICKRWFWPGGVMFSYGLIAIPSWIWNMYNYWQHPPYPGEFALAIGLFSFPFIVAGAFCLWRGWPRTGVKYPRREWIIFTTVFCAFCLVLSLLNVASSARWRDILSFSDNFQDGKADGWDLQPGWQVVNENGNYVLSCQSQDFQRASPRVTSASDYALSADFMLLKGLFEFHVRQSSTSSYNVWIYDNRVVLGRETGKNIVDLGNADMDIGTNLWHKVEISLSGGNIRVYVDDYLKIDYQDENPLPSGRFLIQNHPDSGVQLDNIVVKPSATPTPTSTSTATPATTPKTTPTPAVTHSPDELVTFADLNLEVAIREAIGLPVGDIHISDLKGLTNLEANYERIAKLNGLEYCTDLVSLSLTGNKIADIAPLSSLTNLTNLTNLNLEENQINNVSPLGNLTGLRVLHLAGNQVGDKSSLSNLHNLTILSLSGNTVTDISSLSDLTSLSVLYLPGTLVSDIRPLSGLIELTRLYLQNNQISDISPLSKLTSLTYLEIDGNQIHDISSLSNLSNLSTIIMNRNMVGDVSPLSGLTQLAHLELQSNQIGDIFPLLQNNGLSSGDTVDLRNNPLSTASVTVYIPQLKQKGVVVWSD